METGQPWEGLSEQDYLQVFEVLGRLHRCRSRGELKACIEKQFLPLFRAQACAWGWLEMDLAAAKISGLAHMDHVGYPDSAVEGFKAFSTYNQSSVRFFSSHHRSVIAYGIDVPIEEFEREKEAFLTAHPEYRSDKYFPYEDIYTGIGILDRPEGAVALGFHRKKSHAVPWTFREVRLLEILQPHLVQTIKTIYLSEALKKFQALARVLAEVPVPLGLADRDFCLLFQNESLQKLAALSDGKKLPEDLIRALEQEVNRMKEPFPPKSPLPALPFVRVGGQSRRLEVNRIDSGQEAERGDWLLRFKPVEDSYSRSNLLMQEAGLTPREMEVTILLRDGLVNQEIADRLWIRPSTVQNHVKQIYQKFGVHSRTQLLARLGNGGGT